MGDKLCGRFGLSAIHRCGCLYLVKTYLSFSMNQGEKAVHVHQMQGRNVPTILRIPSFAVVVVVVVEIITIIVRTLSHVARSESVKFRLAVLVIYGNCLLRAKKTGAAAKQVPS